MADSFEIITYVSGGYDRCLAITLPTWLANTSAERIVIYTDGPGNQIRDQVSNDASEKMIEWRQLFNELPESLPSCYERKIVVLLNAFNRCQTTHFCWLDADVMATADFKEAFAKMGSNEIGGTRMFNQTIRGKGELNAGVIFFQNKPDLGTFFLDWMALAKDFKANGNGGRWYEQASASRLIHSAFRGERSYSAAALPEDLYNCEDDSTKQWFARIERFRPKLIHMKGGRWEVPEMLQRLSELTPQIREYYARKS